MNNIKQARFVKSSFMFLVISLLMLSSPSIGEAQDNSTECKWVTILMLKPKYNGITNTLEWEFEPDSICVPARTETKSAASRGVPNVAPSSFSVSANNALLGSWKYVKYMEKQQYPGVKTTPLIEKMVTITFHQNGVLDFRDQSAFVGGVSFQDIND